MATALAGAAPVASADVPVAAAQVLGGLVSVSCATDTACVAVGTLGGKPVAEVGAGRQWRVSHPVEPSRNSGLNDVACAAANLCFAVGTTSVGNASLVERWDGAAWTVETSAVAGGLSAVSCPALTYCVAVGDAGGHAPSAQAWDGAKWQALPAPPRPGSLYDVSCASPTSCLALGRGPSAGNPRFRPATELWNGAQWTDVTSTRLNSNNHLASVDCRGKTCTLVGVALNTGQATVAAYRGTAWLGPDRLDGTAGDTLDDVSCTGPASCLALGSGPDGAPVAFSSDNRTWTGVPAPDVQGALDCHLTTVCVAVGHDDDFRPAVQLRDGDTWVDADVV